MPKYKKVKKYVQYKILEREIVKSYRKDEIISQKGVQYRVTQVQGCFACACVCV